MIYIAGGKLIYETSMVPWVERIVSADALSEGKLQVRYMQTMTARPFGRQRRDVVNGVKLSERKFDRCILSPSYDGLSVGADLRAWPGFDAHTVAPIRFRERSNASILRSTTVVSPHSNPCISCAK